MSTLMPMEICRVTPSQGQVNVREEEEDQDIRTNSFVLFPELPLELQRLIWEFASIILARHGRRTIYVAPDLESDYDPNTDTAFWAFPPGHTDGQLLALPEPHSVPSLLAVCRESRLTALHEYTTWEIADPTTFSPTQKRLYVNMACDTVSFPRSSNWCEFVILGMLGIEYWADLDREAIREWVHYDDSALRKYVQQLAGLQSLEMTFWQWDGFFSHKGALRWLRYFPGLKTLRVVLEYLDQETLDQRSEGEQTTSGAERDADEAKVRWLFGNYLNVFHEEFQAQELPQVQVVHVDGSVIGCGVSSIKVEISNAMWAGEERFGKYLTR